MIPLICLDVDGTLVGSDGTVSRAVWAAAEAAIARGQHLAVSTARGAFGASWEMAQRLDPDGWHVFHAGAAVVNTGTGRVRSHGFDAGVIEAASAVAAQNDWIIEYYSATDYSVESSEPFAVDHARLLGVPFRRRTRDELGTDEIVRIQFVVPEQAVASVHDATATLELTVSSATSPVMPGAAFVSLTPRGVTKATGIEDVAAALGLGLADVMMVGDGLNDLPALEAVGHPVAMGNAACEVRAAATHLVADVNRDGVVEALELSVRLSSA